MSGLEFLLAERRADLVAALDGLTVTVGGKPVVLTALPDQPAPVDRYQTWPVWLQGTPYTSCLTETTWQVIVTLPSADQISMIDAANALINTVGDALIVLGQITAVRPARLIVGTDEVGVPILQFDITI